MKKISNIVFLLTISFCTWISLYTKNVSAQLKVGKKAPVATSTPLSIDKELNQEVEKNESTGDVIHETNANANANAEADVESDEEGQIPLYRFDRSQNYPLWSFGFNFGLNDVMGPNQLSSNSSPGLIWGIETTYRQKSTWTARASLGQQDVTESQLGVNYLFVGADLNIPIEFLITPYVGFGISLNSVNGYGSDYFNPGFGMYVGGDYIFQSTSKWSISPRFQYSQILSKGGREAVDFWSLLVSVAYTFDESEFSDNVKILNPKK